ncbi:hypothetical protein MRX96_010243 [Rhipicephalus microplus]
MNMYISEMASLVPMCKDMSRKLGKLTVPRMVEQHIKTCSSRSLRSTNIVPSNACSINLYTEGHYELPWLLEEDIKNVVLQTINLALKVGSYQFEEDMSCIAW